MGSHYMHERSSREAGFTLVELMVVVLIIGILVTIAMPVYAQVTSQAQARGCQANQRTVSGAIDVYISAYGHAPSSQAGELVAGGSGWFAILVPDWMRSQPSCPVDQTSYLLDAAGSIAGDNGAAAGFKPEHKAP